MKQKIHLFTESLKLVWQSSHKWALTNISLSLVRSILPLLLVWLLKNVVDAITFAAGDRQGSLSQVILPVLALGLVWFLDEALSNAGNYVRKKQSIKLESYMYDLLHSKAVGLDLIHFENPAYFDCLSRAAREAPWRPNSILNNIISLLRSLLSLILMTLLITTHNMALALVLLAANIPAIWLRIHYSDVLYKLQRQQTPEARKASYFNWLLTGDRPAREIRLFGLGEYFRNLFKTSFTNQKEEELKISRRRMLIEFFSDLFKSIAFVMTILIIANQAVAGNITLGEMAMLLIAFRQGMIYIKDFSGAISGLYEDSLFAADTFEFLNLKENITALADPVVPSPVQKGIKADNISFTYPGNSFKAIDNISFEIKKGEVIALVGSNGAGKTTLAKLLCRLYDPDAGSIMYDSTDIRKFNPDLYRKQFSVIFQDYMLYNLTAGENIRLGKISCENAEEKIRKCAEATGIHDVIDNLPLGYKTPIGNLFDTGRELSWGEWQKIALARALFREAPVLILDEPSGSLDADTEYEIFNRFREIAAGRTSILITHRFTNISMADRIIVLEKGKISEAGTHKELMEKRGRYYIMYTKQFSR